MPQSVDQSASAVIKPNRRRRVSSTLTLALATVVAVCAISAVVALTWHANGSRDNEAKVDDVRRTVTGGFETAEETEGGGFEAPEPEEQPV